MLLFYPLERVKMKPELLSSELYAWVSPTMLPEFKLQAELLQVYPWSEVGTR